MMQPLEVISPFLVSAVPGDIAAAGGAAIVGMAGFIAYLVRELLSQKEVLHALTEAINRNTTELQERRRAGG